MVLKQDNYFAEAIFFFDGDDVVKEILYVEFEAVLDSVVGIPEFARKEYKAAYVTVGAHLTLKTVVLFNIKFDKDGHVVKEWNIPLHALTRDAVTGPDLGQGNIQLVTKKTYDGEHKKSLWSAGKQEIAVLTSIRDAVKRNKLGLYEGGDRRSYGARAVYRGVPNYDLDEIGSELLQDELQQNLIQNIEATLKHKYEAKINQLKEKQDELVRQLEVQVDALNKQNGELQQQLEKEGSQNKEHLEVIAEKYKRKFEKQMDEVHDALSDDLSAKELELQYSQESGRQMQEEMEQFKKLVAEEKKNQLLEFQLDLINSGVELIVTQAGVGSYSLKLEQIKGYMESPTGFWAKQCGVPEAQYLAWYQHYMDPVCQAGKSTGCGCNVAVERVTHPEDFVAGFSEMCSAHQLKQSKDAALGY